MAEAELICDRIGIVHHGRLRGVGTNEELMTRSGEPTLIKAFLSLIADDGETGDAADVASRSSRSWATRMLVRALCSRR